LAYGITPYFLAYPGTISVRVATYLNLIEDILNSLAKTGFRRIVIVNGHGGNTPAESLIVEWLNMHPEMKVKFHNWWRGPQVWAKVMEIDPVASHASWMENFPWTRLPGIDMPAMRKQLPKREGLPQFNAITARAFYGDGNFNGYYQRSDEEMQAIWQVAVAETRGLLTAVWD
jgi:creatinine amidohydrolase